MANEVIDQGREIERLRAEVAATRTKLAESHQALAIEQACASLGVAQHWSTVEQAMRRVGKLGVDDAGEVVFYLDNGSKASTTLQAVRQFLILRPEVIAKKLPAEGANEPASRPAIGAVSVPPTQTSPRPEGGPTLAAMKAAEGSTSPSARGVAWGDVFKAQRTRAVEAASEKMDGAPPIPPVVDTSRVPVPSRATAAWRACMTPQGRATGALVARPGVDVAPAPEGK